jgi:hypothetical protein
MLTSRSPIAARRRSGLPGSMDLMMFSIVAASGGNN